jgi:hypothetical protein
MSQIINELLHLNQELLTDIKEVYSLFFQLNTDEIQEYNQTISEIRELESIGAFSRYFANKMETKSQEFNRSIQGIYSNKREILDKLKEMMDLALLIEQEFHNALQNPQKYATTNEKHYYANYQRISKIYEEIQTFVLQELEYEDRFLDGETQVDAIYKIIKDINESLGSIKNSEIKKLYEQFFGLEIDKILKQNQISKQEQILTNFYCFHKTLIEKVFSYKTKYKNLELIQHALEDFLRGNNYENLKENEIEGHILKIFEKRYGGKFSDFNELKKSLFNENIDDEIIKKINKVITFMVEKPAFNEFNVILKDILADFKNNSSKYSTQYKLYLQRFISLLTDDVLSSINFQEDKTYNTLFWDKHTVQKLMSPKILKKIFEGNFKKVLIEDIIGPRIDELNHQLIVKNITDNLLKLDLNGDTFRGTFYTLIRPRV